MKNLITILLCILTLIVLPETSQSQTTYEVTIQNTRPLQEDFLGFNATNSIRDWNGPNNADDGWQNETLLESVHRLHSNNVRFPGGELANWWSTRRGWFRPEYELPAGYIPPLDWKTLTTLPNTVPDYERGLAYARGKNMFILNILTSDFAEQLGSIFEYCGNNMPVDYLELGNEFYLNQRPFIDKYPTGVQMAEKSVEWADDLNDITKFPCLSGTYEIASVGAWERADNRSNEWNAELNSGLGTNANVNAVTLHFYPNAAATGVAAGMYQVTGTQSGFPHPRGYPLATDFDRILGWPAYLYDITLADDVNDFANRDVWITEYNILENTYDIYGSWLHGLQMAALTLHFLEEPNIAKLCNFTIFNRAMWGSIFSNNNGYALSPNHGLPAGNNTVGGSVSAPGYALAYIANAMKHNEVANQLHFATAPPNSQTPQEIGGLTGYLDEIYGWQFDNNAGPDFGEKIVVLNLSDDFETIDLSGISDIDFQIEIHGNNGVSAGAIPPLMFPRENATNITPYTSADQLFESLPQQVSNLANITLAPYSVNYFYEDVSEVEVTTLDDEACNGDNVFVYANVSDYLIANPNYIFDWSFSGNGTEVIQSINYRNDFVFEYQIPALSPTSSHTITFSVRDGMNNLVKSDFVTIEVDEPPSIQNLMLNSDPFSGGNISFECGELENANISYNVNTVPGLQHCAVIYPEHGVNDPFGANVNIAPDKFTEYRLIVMDERGCTDQVDFSITPIPLAFAGPDLYICESPDNEQQTQSDPGVAGYDYVWTDANSNVISYDAIPTISSNMMSVYEWPKVVTLTLTIQDDGNCVSSDELTIHFIDCCENCPAPDLILKSHDRISEIIADQSSSQYLFREAFLDTLTGQIDTIYSFDFSDPEHPDPTPCDAGGTFLVKGKIIIDRNFRLENMILKMGEKAHFVVEPGSNFEIIGSAFEPCSDYMWAGIEARNYRSSIIIDQNMPPAYTCRSSFTGADTVVIGEMDASIGIRNSDFNENYVHVYLNDFVRNHVVDINSRTDVIINNNFTCVSDELLSPYAGDRTFASIVLNDVNDVTIGSHLENSGNHFENCDYGINSLNSTLTVLGNNFQSIRYNNRNGESGHCIMADATLQTDPGTGGTVHPNEFMNVLINGFGEKNVFSESNIGIWSRMMHSTVQTNDFSSVERAIKIVESDKVICSVIDNEINQCKYGVDLLQNTNSTILVDNNDISTIDVYLDDAFQLVSSIAIRQADNFLSRPARINFVDITNNEIELNGTHGIWIQSTMNTDVIDNVIDMNQTLTSTGPCPYRFFGIVMEESEEIDLCNNTVMGPGLSVNAIREQKIAISQNSTLNCVLRCNITDDTRYGIEFIGNSGATKVHGNAMNSHDVGWSFGADACLAQPSWAIDDLLGLMQDPAGGGNPVDVAQGNIFNLGGNWDTYKNGYNSAGGIETQYEFSNGNTLFPDLNGWDPNFANPSQLLAAIDPQGILDDGYACGTNNNQFCSELQLLGGGGEESVEHLEEISDPESNESSEVYDTKKEVYFEIEENPELTDSSTIIDLFYDSVLTTNLASLSEIYSIISDTMSNNVDSLLAVAYTLNSSLYPISQTQINEKEFNRISIEHLQGDDLFSNAISLFDLANQCPYTAGSVVFSARALLSLINDSVYFNDADLCQPASGNRELQNDKEYFDTYVNVYPIPTSDNLIVELPVEHNFTNLNVIDFFGRTVLSRLIQDRNSVIVGLEFLNPGQYILQLSGESNYMKRISVIK